MRLATTLLACALIGLSQSALGQAQPAPVTPSLVGWPADLLDVDTTYLRTHFGAPKELSRYRSPGMTEWGLVWVYPALDVYLDLGANAIAVEVTKPGPQTTEGLEVGASLEAVIKMFGEPGEKTDSEWVYSTYGMGADGLRLTIRAGTVSRFWIGSFLTGD